MRREKNIKESLNKVNREKQTKDVLIKSDIKRKKEKSTSNETIISNIKENLCPPTKLTLDLILSVHHVYNISHHMLVNLLMS